jgi:hypothetical protein
MYVCMYVNIAVKAAIGVALTLEWVERSAVAMKFFKFDITA